MRSSFVLYAVLTLGGSLQDVIMHRKIGGVFM